MTARMCVVCGEVFWRVMDEPDCRGRLAKVCCMECITAVALTPGRGETLIERNKRAPWRRPETPPFAVDFAPGYRGGI